MDSCMLNHRCEPGINPTWLWFTIFSVCCWVWFASILLKIVTCIFIKGSVLFFSFLVVSLFLVSE